MKHFSGLALFLVIASFSPLAFAQTFTDDDWNSTGGDNSFETVGNWSNGVPDSTTFVFLLPGSTSNTTIGGGFFPGTGPATMTINASASHDIAGLIIDNGFATSDQATVGSVTMTFASGTTLTVADEFSVSGGQVLNFSGNLTLETSAAIGTSSFYSTNNSGTMNFSGGTLNATGVLLEIGLDSTGVFTQSGSSTSAVIAADVILGGGGGNGTYVLTGTGANTLTTNLLNIGTGTFTQSDSNSVVTVGSLNLGADTATNALYQLQSGTLTTNILSLGYNTGSTGILNQSGGVFTATGAVEIGSVGGGTGTYILSGGTADFQSGFSVGDGVGSSISQSGATVLTAEGAVSIGANGEGTYNLSGTGTATFADGITIGGGGLVNQTGGTLSVGPNQHITLNGPGAAYNLGGTGILQVNQDTLSVAQGATFNFTAGNGTLQIMSTGTFTDNINSVLMGNAIIDAATTPGVTTVTMAGDLSGPGGITFEGGAATTFQFTGDTTYTGATGIASGTLNATSAQIADSSALIIGNGGAIPAVLNLTLGAGGFAYAGALAGPGELKVNFAANGDPFVVLNASSFTGAIILGANGNSGALQVYNGSYGNISDNGTDSSVVIGGASLATLPNGVTAPTSGSVTFTGDANYRGSTMVNSGFTLTAQNIFGEVTNNGTLYALSSGTLTNTGTVGLSSANDSIFHVGGDFSSGAGSTIIIRYDGLGATAVNDSFVATGSVTTDSTGVIIFQGAGLVSTPTPIITGGAPPDGGDTSDLPQVESGLLVSVHLSIVGDSIDYTATQHPTATYATTPNEAAAAAAVDAVTANSATLAGSQRAAFSTLLGGFNQFTTGSQIAAALEQLTPETLQYARNIAFENSSFLAQRMNGIDANLRGGYQGLDTSAINVMAPGFSSGLGQSLGSLLAYNDPSFHEAAPNGVNYYPGEAGRDSSPATSTSAPTWDSSSQVISDSPNPYLATVHPGGPETPKISEFIGGDVVLADLNQSQNLANAPSSKASYTAGDATAGVGFRMTNHLAAGVLFDYNHTDAKLDSSGSKTKVDSYSPGLFATYYDKGFYVNGLFSFGYNNYSNTRNISAFGQTATSKPSGQQYVGDLDVGYDFHPVKNWVVGPTLGVTYTHLDIDSFTETGAPGANLAVDSQSADSLRSRLGGHVVFSTDTGPVLLQPNLTAMWQHEFMADSSGITSSFNDFGSSPFTIETAAPSRDSALIGCGLTASLSNSMALYLNYLADVGASDYFAQTVIGGFKARF